MDNRATFTGTGTGHFVGSGFLTVATGASVVGYSLVFNDSFSSNSNPGTFTVSIPQNSIDLNAVPEPGTWALLGMGLAAVGACARRRRPAAR